MKTSNQGIDHIKKWEGLRLKAYQCTSGVWTIGYGHTSAAGGLKVYEGLEITREKAENILRSDLVKFEKRVNDLVVVPLTQTQFDALVSFDFNTGKLHKSTLLKKLNSGDYNAVPSELNKWVFSSKRRVKGLVNRRADEITLWNSQAVRDVDEPRSGEVFETKKPFIESTTNMAAAASAATGLVAAFGDLNPWLAGLVIVLAAGWIMRERYLKMKEHGV